MPRPPLKFEPGENPPPEDLDENLHSSPGEDYTEGVEDEFDELQSEDSSEGGEEPEVEGRPSARETGQEPRRGDRIKRRLLDSSRINRDGMKRNSFRIFRLRTKFEFNFKGIRKRIADKFSTCSSKMLCLRTRRTSHLSALQAQHAVG